MNWRELLNPSEEADDHVLLITSSGIPALSQIDVCIVILHVKYSSRRGGYIEQSSMYIIAGQTPLPLNAYYVCLCHWSVWKTVSWGWGSRVTFMWSTRRGITDNPTSAIMRKAPGNESVFFLYFAYYSLSIRSIHLRWDKMTYSRRSGAVA